MHRHHAARGWLTATSMPYLNPNNGVSCWLFTYCSRTKVARANSEIYDNACVISRSAFSSQRRYHRKRKHTVGVAGSAGTVAIKTGNGLRLLGLYKFFRA
jgi:hypothetical protein